MKKSFRCLMEPKKTSFLNEMKKNSNIWIKKHNLIDLNNPKVVSKLEKMSLEVFTAHVWPHANREQFKILNCLATWYTIFDDWSENKNVEFKETRIELFKVLDDENFESNNEYVTSFRDIFQGIKKTSSAEFLQRFSKYFKEYLIGIEDEIKFLEKGSFDNIENYISLRRDFSSCNVCFCLAEWTKNINPWKGDNSIILKLMELANDQVSLVNDYFSYDRDKALGNISNLPSVVQKILNYNEEESLDYTFNKVELITDEFEQIYLSIDSENKGLISYAESLIEWMVGHIEWYKHTKRYEEVISMWNKDSENDQSVNLLVIQEEIKH